MSDRSTLKQDFYAVRHVLRTLWNPLGIEGLPDDEYDSYAWQVVRLLHDGADALTLSRHLSEVERFYFGRTTNVAHLAPVSSALLALAIGEIDS